MEIKEIQMECFGKCVQITNGIIDVAVTIDFGPRIIRFGYVGCENVLFTDPDRKNFFNCDGVSPAPGKNTTFYYYGGHRLGLSPARLALHPDNAPVVYSVLPEGVAFLPPKQKQSEVQTGFEVVMGEDASDVMIVHTAKNCSKEVETFGLWPITMVKAGGTVILPQNTDGSDPLLPNRTVVYWPDTDIRDNRIFYGSRYLTLTHSVSEAAPLKIGINNVFGWIAYVEPSFTLMKRYVHNSQAAYPDFGCSAEVGFGKDYIELASLSPVYRVEPGEGIKHVENLSLFKTNNSVNPADEEGLARYIDNLK